jgi:hypothetical protein
MRHIKLFESYRIPNTDTVYVAVVGSTSGPDFNNENLVVFRASNENEARLNFVIAAMGDNRLHDKSILDATYSDFDEFIDDAVSDGYFSLDGWDLYGYMLCEFPANGSMKIGEGEMIAVDNEGWGKRERKTEMKEATDRLVEMVGPDCAYQIIFRYEKELDQSMSIEKAVESEWDELKVIEKIHLAKYHPTLPEEEKRIYRATELNMKRR